MLERISGTGGYRVPGAVWSTRSGIKVDPYDPAFNMDHENTGDSDLPAIYLFSGSRDGDGIAYAMAEDGTVLGTHLCSHWGYMRHDLHDRPRRQAVCAAHYPTGYRLVVLMDPGSLPPPKVIERNRMQGEAERESGT